MSQPIVCCCVPDKLGGVFSFVQNLLAHRGVDELSYEVVLADNRAEPDTRSHEPLNADRVTRVEYELPGENLYAVLRRVSRAIGEGPGVLFTSGWIELAAAAHSDTHKAVVCVVHGDFDYYYDLAFRHDRVIDAFVTYTDVTDRTLRARMPHRAADIHLLRYGVAIPPHGRAPATGPLRVAFVGRMHRDKGIFLIPDVDARLRAAGVDVLWTMQGDGPDRASLQSLWSSPNITWHGQRPASEVLDLYLHQDVLILTGRFEALPVALLEAGAAGVVPVVTDLASGVPEVVEHGVTGFRAPVDDVESFARDISSLHADREMLERMSEAVRARVRERFDGRHTVRAYQQLFARWETLRRPRPRSLPISYGSRLDQPWLPNAAVRAARFIARAFKPATTSH